MALKWSSEPFDASRRKWPAGHRCCHLSRRRLDRCARLLVNTPGEKERSDSVLPVLSAGPAIAPEAPSILPADTEMLITMSLDLPQVFTTLMKPEANARYNIEWMGKTACSRAAYDALEKRLNIKIKERPAAADRFGDRGERAHHRLRLDSTAAAANDHHQPYNLLSPSPTPTERECEHGGRNCNSVARRSLSLRDKEGMRALLPKMIESLAFKGANAFAQTERRGDTELVTYANVLSYAFIGDFLVLA